MSRTALVSSGSDPFLILTCHKLFQKYYYDELDSFRVNLNNASRFPLEVRQELVADLIKDPKVKLIYRPEGGDPGQAIKELLLTATEDLVLLLEEDGYIFTPGEVSKCFKRIESGEVDALGSPRGSCGEEIAEASRVKYGLDYTHYGDNGANFWPNFFFCKRSDLLKTDLDFGSKQFNAGEYCKELDYTFKEVNCADTFVWASIQLRAMGLKIGEIPQHKADVNEVESKTTGMMNWINGVPKWIHAGSLSSGWGGYLSGTIPDLPDEGSKKEMETRVSFWMLANNMVDGFDDFKKPYQEGILNLMAEAKLNAGRINAKYDLYKELMKL